MRDGGQLLARDGALRASGLDLSRTGILTEIRRTLCPGDEQDPVAELYALNVYGARGHFVAHKDTPRDPEVFGTLVVCLPVPFRGGGLVLHHDSIRRFEWETAFPHLRLPGALIADDVHRNAGLAQFTRAHPTLERIVCSHEDGMGLFAVLVARN